MNTTQRSAARALIPGLTLANLPLPASDPATTMQQAQNQSATETFWANVGMVLGTAGVAVGAYHGWRRDRSIGWAIGWALLGGLAPVIVIPVALAQGIGKPKGG